MWQVFRKIFSSDQKTFRTLHVYILVAIVLAVLSIYYSQFFGGYRGFSPLWYLTIFEFFTSSFGILFVIPLTYAAIFMNSQTLLITWLVCSVLMFPRVSYLSFHLDSLVISYLIYTLPFFISMFVKTAVLSRQMERKAAAEKEEQRQNFLSQVFNAHENERKNIARELHDSVIQSLIVMTNQAQSIISNKNLPVQRSEIEGDLNSVVEKVVTLRDSSREISKEIRNICLDLRPYMIDDMGLIPALRWFIDRSKTNINLVLTTDGAERRFSAETELMIYRIVQEAINNIKRHSTATEARVHFNFCPGDLNITIEDNGKGFVVPEKTTDLTKEGKLGLIGIQERVKLLNGRIRIASQLGKGTVMTIESAI